MDKQKCCSIPNCCLCPDAVLIEPKGFNSFKEVVDIWGLWEALSIAEVVCPYKLLIEDLQKGGGLNGRNIE